MLRITNVFGLGFVVCVFVTLINSVGCGAKVVRVEDRIIGAWQGRYQIDQAAVEKRIQETKDISERLMLEAAVQTMGNAGATFDIDLKKDGTFQSKLAVGETVTESSGTWQLKNVEGLQATLVTTENETSHEHPLTLDADFLTGAGGFSTPAPGPLAALGALKFKRL
jgi:hypothetical protein